MSVQHVTATGTTTSFGSSFSATASCPSGKVAVGGGFSDGSRITGVVADKPGSNGTSWVVTATSNNTVSSTAAASITAYVVCATGTFTTSVPVVVVVAP